MCDLDADPCPVSKEHTRKARKPHTCLGCSETIRPQDTYIETRSLYDGAWSTMKHCRRCYTLIQVLFKKSDHMAGIDPGLNCGETWVDNFGPPPPEVEALAFMLPGEPVPAREDFPSPTPNQPER